MIYFINATRTVSFHEAICIIAFRGHCRKQIRYRDLWLNYRLRTRLFYVLYSNTIISKSDLITPSRVLKQQLIESFFHSCTSHTSLMEFTPTVLLFLYEISLVAGSILGGYFWIMFWLSTLHKAQSSRNRSALQTTNVPFWKGKNKNQVQKNDYPTLLTGKCPSAGPNFDKRVLTASVLKSFLDRNEYDFTFALCSPEGKEFSWKYKRKPNRKKKWRNKEKKERGESLTVFSILIFLTFLPLHH